MSVAMPRKRRRAAKLKPVAMGHVWTAPALQKRADHLIHQKADGRSPPRRSIKTARFYTRRGNVDAKLHGWRAEQSGQKDVRLAHEAHLLFRSGKIRPVLIAPAEAPLAPGRID